MTDGMVLWICRWQRLYIAWPTSFGPRYPKDRRILTIQGDRLQYSGQRQTEAMSLAPRYHEWIVKEFEPYIGDTVAEVEKCFNYCKQALLKGTK